MDPRDAGYTDRNESTPIGKKRRGRQPRPSLLTQPLREAISKFASVIGAPVIQPGGFRDFSGWLDSISRTNFSSAWFALADAVLSECPSVEPDQQFQLKRDVVHEVIHLVVKRKPHESVKLVSTNARRQSTIPPSGSSVMTILESYLAIVSGKRHANSPSLGKPPPTPPPSWSAPMPPPPSSSRYSSSSAPRSNAVLRSSSYHVRTGNAHALLKPNPLATAEFPRTSQHSELRISSLLSQSDARDRFDARERLKLPSLSQLDAHLLARSRKERDKPPK